MWSITFECAAHGTMHTWQIRGVSIEEAVRQFRTETENAWGATCRDTHEIVRVVRMEKCTRASCDANGLSCESCHGLRWVNPALPLLA